MKTACMVRVVFFAGVLLGPAASWGAEASLDVPMDRQLVSVLVRLGLKDAEPTTWDGTYRLTKGRVVATDGWRFAGDDYASLDKFRVSNRRLYPRFFQRRGGSESSLPVEPNGFVLTLADLDSSSVLEVSTSGGEFKVPVGGLGYGGAEPRMEGNADFRRVPTSRQIVKSPAEDAYPSALLGPGGRLCVAYLAFRHGIGCEDRLPIATDPEDYSFLGKPTGGDQLMFTECQEGVWATPVPLTKEGGDLFGTAMAVDGQGRLWAFWSANENDNWDLYGAVRGDRGWSEAIRISDAAGSDFHHVAATDAEGRVWLAWQSLNATQSDILVARQDGTGFGAPTVVAGGPSNKWEPAIAAGAGGQVAVAWDTYERGQYDVVLKTWQAGTWSEPRVIAATLRNEARPSLAYDAEHRLWISYEISPEGWGKDFGPYDEGPQRLPLYREREVGVQVLANGVLSSPQADLGEALPMPGGQRRRQARPSCWPRVRNWPSTSPDACGWPRGSASISWTATLAAPG